MEKRAFFPPKIKIVNTLNHLRFSVLGELETQTGKRSFQGDAVTPRVSGTVDGFLLL